jgi:hypothetical protein
VGLGGVLFQDEFSAALLRFDLFFVFVLFFCWFTSVSIWDSALTQPVGSLSRPSQGFPVGMNTTLSRSENERAWGAAWCAVMQVIVQAALPAYPSFVGYDLSNHGGNGPCAIPS